MGKLPRPHGHGISSQYGQASSSSWFGWRICLALIVFLLAACVPAAQQAGEASQNKSEHLASETAKPQPNFLVILVDDLGYNDLSLFGSEIQTPSIDALAERGIVLTSYYAAPLCAPTRAELLSGTSHHRAGNGMMQVNVQGNPNYQGRLSRRVVSLAQRLSDAGYSTMMTGKWHLGLEAEHSPTAHGFARSFVLLEGGGSHYGDQVGALQGMRASYREDGDEVESLPADFYSTDFYTDKMLSYLRQNQESGKPFFAYLAYTAPHWPTQAPVAEIAKHAGRYDEGYDVIRERRFERWKSLGYAGAEAQLPNLPVGYRPWASLSDDERAISSRTMEVYAAMVTRLDQKVGEVIDYLKRSGQFENTIVLFQSDNGAEGGRHRHGFTQGDNRLESIGRPGSWAYIGLEWAEAGSAPFFLSKSYATEGGIRVPAILNAAGIKAQTSHVDAALATFDVAPTFLELAGVATKESQNSDAVGMTGRSFAGLIDPGIPFVPRGEQDVVGQEHAGQAALRKGDWKLLWVGNSEFYQGVQMPGPPPMSGVPQPRARFDRGSPAGTPIGNGGPWKLFNLKSDPAEKHDLAAAHPEVLTNMLAEWKTFSAEHNVILKSGVGEAGN